MQNGAELHKMSPISHNGSRLGMRLAAGLIDPSCTRNGRQTMPILSRSFESSCAQLEFSKQHLIYVLIGPQNRVLFVCKNVSKTCDFLIVCSYNSDLYRRRSIQC